MIYVGIMLTLIFIVLVSIESKIVEGWNIFIEYVNKKERKNKNGR